ncbi:MAG: YqgE/AlgH family protein [Acidobacteria bacterium]|jgi:putative transcriptional regulator|nr:YqgE/AlgH family protein [Acidobacteriota bacterium]
MEPEPTSLAGQLLIAMPTLADPNFWHSVVLLGVHSREEGAFGLIINRPTDLDMADVLQELGQDAEPGSYPEVLSGGPVEPSHGFVVFCPATREPDESLLLIDSTLAVSGDTETLTRLSQRQIEGPYHLILGYSGWAPGQLEKEIEENSWLVAPIDRSLVFQVPFPERWNQALRSIGVDPGTLVDLGSGSPS